MADKKKRKKEVFAYLKKKLKDLSLTSKIQDVFSRFKKREVVQYSSSVPIYNPSYSTIPMSKIKFVGDYQKGKARAREQQKEEFKPDPSKGMVSFKDYLTAVFNIPEIKNIGMKIGEEVIETDVNNFQDGDGNLFDFVEGDFLINLLQTANFDGVEFTRLDGVKFPLANAVDKTAQENQKEAFRDLIKNLDSVKINVNGKQIEIPICHVTKENGDSLSGVVLGDLVDVLSETEITQMYVEGETCASMFNNGVVSNFVKNKAGEFIPVEGVTEDEITDHRTDVDPEKEQKKTEEPHEEFTFENDPVEDENDETKDDESYVTENNEDDVRKKDMELPEVDENSENIVKNDSNDEDNLLP